MKEDDLSSENSLNKKSFDNKNLINNQEDNEDKQNNEKVKNENEDGDEKESLSTTKLILLLLLFLLGGLINTISLKIQKKINSLGLLFEGHHFFSVLEIFFGKVICLLIYYIKGFFSNEINSDEPRQQPSVKYFILLAILDILSNIIIIFNASMINNSSSFQFLSILIILSQIISIKFLDTINSRHHILAVFLSFVGLLMGEIKGMQINRNSAGFIALGIFLIIVAQVFQGAH